MNLILLLLAGGLVILGVILSARWLDARVVRVAYGLPPQLAERVVGR